MQPILHHQDIIASKHILINYSAAVRNVDHFSIFSGWMYGSIFVTNQRRAMNAEVSTGLARICPSRAGFGSVSQRNTVSLVPRLIYNSRKLQNVKYGTYSQYLITYCFLFIWLLLCFRVGWTSGLTCSCYIYKGKTSDYQQSLEDHYYVWSSTRWKTGGNPPCKRKATEMHS